MKEFPRRLVLVGHPVSHSLSPLFQNAALQDAGIPLRYELLDASAGELADTFRALRTQRAAGNVTIPHKTAVAALCDELEPAARRTGAVNTFWTENETLVGDNTDVDGFNSAVVGIWPGTPNNIVVGVLGAGGAAAAVLAAVETWEGCTALVHNRTLERAAALCARFGHTATVSGDAELVAQSQLVVNATAIGLRDDNIPLDPLRLRGDAVVLDLVYRVGETPWVHAARKAGLRAADGLTMLVEQGACAFERWFGRAPNRDVMCHALRGE